MTDEDCFASAIRTNPHDVTARAAFHDWLLERCEPGDAEKAAILRAGKVPLN